jgi:hypothetical protein
MSKNTHLEHLEDSILLDGKKGAEDAFKFLDSLARTFTGKGSSNFKMTTKWDGAPAIFCGQYPGTDHFFVGTKSIFNKDAKINYTETDIDNNHGHAPGLASKLKAALKYLPSIGIKGVVQGDLLFTDDKNIEIIDGKKSITFKPNTITYAIPKEDSDYDLADAAKIGVVFHTTYTGSSIERLHASFGFDPSTLTKDKDVFVISAEIDTLGKDVLLTSQEKQKLISLKQSSSQLVKTCGSFLDGVAKQIAENDQLSIGVKLKQYFNKYVREGKQVGNSFTSDFKNYFSTECKKAADKLKTPKGKAGKLAKLYDGRDFIDSHGSQFSSTVKLYKIIQDAKEIFVTKLEKGEKFGTYIRTDKGLEMTAQEGYVAIQNGKATKLIKRLVFSQANFDVSLKGWS